MRFVTLILIVFASWCAAFAQPVSFKTPSHKVNITLKEFLNEVESRRRVKFFFDGEWVNGIYVNKSYVGIEISTALKEICAQQPVEINFIYDYGIVLIEHNEKELLTANIADSIKSNFEQLIIGTKGANRWGSSVTLKGRIIEEKFSGPVEGVTITTQESKIAAVTNSNGEYDIPLTVGSHLLKFQSLNYNTKTYLLTIYENGNLEIVLEENPLTLREIVVESNLERENFETEVTARTRLSAEQIQQIPAFLGEVDVIKSIQLLPGVNNIGEGSSGFNVRGGSADQNLILLDEAIVFNPNHLFGFFSAFHPDAINEVTFYRGAIPAEFGGRVSSVLDVKQKDGNFDELHGYGGLGLVTSRLLLEGPILKEKFSFLIAGRTSYSNWILNQVNDINVRNSNAYFYDITSKLAYKNSDKSKLTATLYASHDTFQFASDTSFSWSNKSLSLNHEKIISPTLSIKSTLSAGGYDYKVEDEDPNESFIWEYQLLNARLKSQLNYSKNKHDLQAGIDFTGYEFKRGSIVPTSDGSSIESTEIPKDRALVSGLFISDNIQFNDKFLLSLGLRLSNYQLFGAHNQFSYQNGLAKSDFSIIDTVTTKSGQIAQQYFGFEPRISGKYSLNNSSIIKAGFVRSYQYIHLLSNTTAISPIDMWTPSTAHIAPQIGLHYSVGFYKSFVPERIKASVEVFYKSIDNVPEYRDGAQLQLKENVETEIVNSEADIRGLELSVQKEGRLSANFSYTFTSSRRRTSSSFAITQINDNELFPSNYDQPHNIKLNTEYEFSKRHILLFNFNMASGRPITIPEERFRIENNFIGNFSERNSFRLPMYHRLDVTLLIKSNHRKNKKWEGSWAFTIYNVYSRNNVYSVFFQPDRFGRPTAYQLAILGAAFPSVTYNFKF